MSERFITIAEAYGWKLRVWRDRKGNTCSGWTTPDGEQCGGIPEEWMLAQIPLKIARLIAAAPELLEALNRGDFLDGTNGPDLIRYAADLIEVNMGTLPTVKELRRKADSEEAAIAKATGKAADSE